MEIERKFLLKEYPRQGMKAWGKELELVGESVLEQGYLYYRAPVVRIRSREERGEKDYRLCVKGEGMLARQEVETPLSREDFLTLKGMLPLPLVRKEQRVYRLPGGLLLECNLVAPGERRSFAYGEVEFPTLEAAKRFVPPPELGYEVTEDPYYTMAGYWSRGLLWFR